MALRSMTRRFFHHTFRRFYSNQTAATTEPISKLDELRDRADQDEDIDQFKATLDPTTRERLERYMSELEVFKYADSRMPSKLTAKNWRRLLIMDSKPERIRYYTFLFDVERAEEKERLEKLRTQEEGPLKAAKARTEIFRQKQEHIYYGIGGSCIFRRILECDMNRTYNAKLATAMTFGPHMIIDMSFLPLLRPVESALTAKQLAQVHHENRVHRSPHHLIFTGCKPDHPSWQDVNKIFVDGLDSRIYTVTEKNYLDLFPKERLVYLSPDAKLPMTEYESEKVYVMAAIVDKMARPNLTLGKAKEEGIECRRLPLERCIRLVGRKALCLNHITGMLNDAHAYGSIAVGILNHMPKHKIVPRHTEASRTKREYYQQRLKYLTKLGETT